MQLLQSSREDLGTLLKICEKPLKCPGKPLGHEDVPRSKDGAPIKDISSMRGSLTVLYPSAFESECEREKTHLGCPHFLQHIDPDISLSSAEEWLKKAAMDTPFRRAIISLIRNMPNKAKPLVLQLRKALATSEGLDRDMRLARTGAETDGELSMVIIPDGPTAELNAATVAEAFALHNKTEIEPIRLELVALIKEMLAS